MRVTKQMLVECNLDSPAHREILGDFGESAALKMTYMGLPVGPAVKTPSFQ